MPRAYRFDFKKLEVYQSAFQHYRWCLGVAKRIPWDQQVVRRQMLSAALSQMLNIGEAGGRNTPGDSEKHLRYARGSVYESAAVLDALRAMAIIADEEYHRQEELLARIGAMLSAMIRKKAGQRNRARARSRSPSPSR